ncbi:iron-sulfur protein [Streptomyces sp. NPDC001380]|uniref:iron-sulfur protein n=1 Tax=Streptomyces sp. NPDC001380 TaxID=3364566 RepID=UPI0036980591
MHAAGSTLPAPSAAPPASAGPSPARRGPDPQPCADAYARLARVFPGLRAEVAAPRSGGGWTTGADLAGDPGVLRRTVEAETRCGPERYGGPLRPDVAAGFALHRYAWPACLLFSLPWFLERRVPRLSPAAVSVHRAAGRATAAVDSFACLPGDPAAGLPGARTVAGAAELRAELLAAVAAHLEPVLAAFRPLLRRGPRTLWATATDELVEGLWYAGSLLGEEERAAAELSALLPGGTAPFAGGADFRLLDQGPGRAPMRTRTRVSCCLHYTVRPEAACFGCPRGRGGGETGCGS